jgi:hypothetical protein
MIKLGYVALGFGRARRCCCLTDPMVSVRVRAWAVLASGIVLTVGLVQRRASSAEFGSYCF